MGENSKQKRHREYLKDTVEKNKAGKGMLDGGCSGEASLRRWRASQGRNSVVAAGTARVKTLTWWEHDWRAPGADGRPVGGGTH